MFKLFKKRQPKLYNRCNIMPIHCFNEVSNGDLNYMKINREDKVSDADLEKAWLTIIDEYFILSKEVQGIENLKKKTALTLLQNKIWVYEAIQLCLNKGLNVDNTMKLYGVNAVDLPQYMALIKYDIDDLNSILQKTDVKGDNEFDRMFAIVLKNGFQINRFTTTVSEWIAILNLLEEQSKQQKKENN